nr:hypothetical protein [Bacillus mycoides]
MFNGLSLVENSALINLDIIKAIGRSDAVKQNVNKFFVNTSFIGSNHTIKIELQIIIEARIKCNPRLPLIAILSLDLYLIPKTHLLFLSFKYINYTLFLIVF